MQPGLPWGGRGGRGWEHQGWPPTARSTRAGGSARWEGKLVHYCCGQIGAAASLGGRKQGAQPCPSLGPYQVLGWAIQGAWGWEGAQTVLFCAGGAAWGSSSQLARRVGPRARQLLQGGQYLSPS